MNALVFILLSAAVVTSALVGILSSMGAGAILAWCAMLVMIAVLVTRAAVRHAPADSRIRMEIALDIAALREMQDAAAESADRAATGRI